MLDFLLISTRSTKRGTIEIYPKFIIKKSSDLMIRGGDFYAIWIEQRGLWSTDEQDALQLIDGELDKYAEENREHFDSRVKVLHMWDAESGMIDIWHKYCQRQMRDSFHMLDEKLIFSNQQTSKKDYASKRLNHPLEAGDMPAYEKLMATLYFPEERHKIEWAVGSIITGDSKKLQKFIVIYGEPKSGKSTILNIIQQLFEGYYSAFDAKVLASSNNAFALEAFRNNPLVAIQHDGDLSRIEDNTRLNSLVSHELMTVNEKFKSTYTTRFKCFLFMGTNKPVKITDAKSGLIRRLIDVSPSGEKLSLKDYNTLTKQIKFELGAIAAHCRDVYLENPGKYDNYIPVTMLGASNDFYNFVADSYLIFKKEDAVTLKAAWEMYKTYCEEAKVGYTFSQRVFKEELKNYFKEYKERFCMDDGTRVRSYYTGFRTDKFENVEENTLTSQNEPALIKFTGRKSRFDKEFADCPAQYATQRETPIKKWNEVATKLSDIDTAQLHYVKVPDNHIVIDFDIPDENGEKSFERNLEAASKWPPTYAELSKSGKGIHLHYIYTGDVSRLGRTVEPNVEIKIFTGKSSLRRKLTKCNNLPIAIISSGLPMKGEKTGMIDFDGFKNEKGLRTFIKRNLNRQYHAATKPSIDYICKGLTAAKDSGLKYDVTDMRPAVLAFAANSTHQADYCIKLVNKMPFASDVSESGKFENPATHGQSVGIESKSNNEPAIIFFDIEVFPNLFLVNWKAEGEKKPVARMINPTSREIEKLLQFRLIGFNCRRYDNHILYGRLIGYDNSQLYSLSQKIVNGEPNCFFGEAYNLSYTDVYDFASKKQSLKKWEIELGINHSELGLPWDKPVPEELWNKVAEYCDNDVIATEAVFNARKADFTARRILADVAGMTVNDTTNSLTARIIFDGTQNPQKCFNYRDMGKTAESDSNVKVTPELIFYNEFGDKNYTVFDTKGRPVFPGYKFENGVSTYRGEKVGEGGYVYAEPGMYGNVALLDIASMHPSSIVAENLFGDEYTRRFKDILDARIAIKHKNFEKAGKMLGGKLAKYLTDENTAADLADALKIAINSVYGLTSANFNNPFRDVRNKDNIVAKRGALFMINLKHEVQNRGFKVAHIKTDSIKIPDATPEIIKFVIDYGQQYGYTFEHESTYDRMCLVNNAVYIAKYATVEQCRRIYGDDYVDSSDDNILKDCKKHSGEWTATGAQFQVPYVFKTLFSRENIEFADLCETKSASTALYLDMNENLPEGEHDYRFVGKVGQFCPVKQGKGGGLLLCETKGKGGNNGYSAVTGSKGYRWLESEVVKKADHSAYIDMSYYEKMSVDAISAISKYGDYEWFVSEDDYIPDVAPWLSPCGAKTECFGCPEFHNDEYDIDCGKGYDISNVIINEFAGKNKKES